MAQYNQQNPDGSWSQVTQNSDGSYTVVPISPSSYAAANIPTGGTSSSSTSGQTYSTPNGQRTLAQMQSELQAAGWNGNYGDPASVIAAYNQTASSGAGVSSATQSSAQALLDAIASGNTQDFNEKVREFNQTYALDQQRLGLDQSTQYGNLASSLLSTAANLRGPQDYYQYQKYLSGGKDLFSTLYGSTPQPTFQAPYGDNQPVSLNGLMQSLGLAPATASPTSPVASTAAAVGATPAANTSPTSMATAPAQAPTTPTTGVTAPAAAPTAPPSLAAVGSSYNWGTPPAAIPLGAGGAPQTPNGYQMNPAVWDSIGPVGQALTLSAYSANGGDPNTFIDQLNKARPQGTAPASTSTQFNTSAGAF